MSATLFGIIMLGLVWSVGCLFIGSLFGIVLAEKKAVKQGKAEYYLDENNNKQWRWK